MGWPKGVPRKSSEIKDVQITPLVLTTPKITPIHYDLNLSIRAFRSGNWKGLWELSKLKNDGTREIIIDATSRQSVINMVNRQIMRMVIAS